MNSIEYKHAQQLLRIWALEDELGIEPSRPVGYDHMDPHNDLLWMEAEINGKVVTTHQRKTTIKRELDSQIYTYEAKKNRHFRYFLDAIICTILLSINGCWLAYADITTNMGNSWMGILAILYTIFVTLPVLIGIQVEFLR